MQTSTDTHAHSFTYTNTHTYMPCQFCLLILYLVAICQMSSGPHGPIFSLFLQISPKTLQMSHTLSVYFIVRQGNIVFCCRVLAHLTYISMRLCNHDLSIVCHCHHHWCCHCQHHWHWHVCTAVPVTALLIETLYLAYTCIYIPNIFI